MWPGARRPARRMSSAAASRRSRGPKSSAGSRLPWMPRVVADGLPRLVEVLPPVDADHVAAGFDEVGQDGRRADAEMDQRHAGVGEAVEDARVCGSANSR